MIIPIHKDKNTPSLGVLASHPLAGFFDSIAPGAISNTVNDKDPLAFGARTRNGGFEVFHRAGLHHVMWCCDLDAAHAVAQRLNALVVSVYLSTEPQTNP